MIQSGVDTKPGVPVAPDLERTRVLQSMTGTREPGVVPAEPANLCDITKLKKMMGKDIRMVKRMIEKFLEVAPGNIRGLEEASKHHDPDAIGRTSQKFISAVDLVSNDTMRILIKNICEASKDERSSEELYLMVEQFLNNFEILSGQLRNFVMDD
jgi:hypothetical protein